MILNMLKILNSQYCDENQDIKNDTNNSGVLIFFWEYMEITLRDHQSYRSDYWN